MSNPKICQENKGHSKIKFDHVLSEARWHQFHYSKWRAHIHRNKEINGAVAKCPLFSTVLQYIHVNLEAFRACLCNESEEKEAKGYKHFQNFYVVSKLKSRRFVYNLPILDVYSV
jgi:hypothetical protein